MVYLLIFYEITVSMESTHYIRYWAFQQILSTNRPRLQIVVPNQYFETFLCIFYSLSDQIYELMVFSLS